jgi:hypothetical protein
MKKNIFHRLFIGFKKGLLTPTLPDHIMVLQKNVFIRFIRVLGGISIILIVTHRLEVLGSGLLYEVCLYLCVFFSIIFNIYLMYVNYHRIKYMYKVFKSDKLDVCNSPFDRFATYASRLLWCSKGFCDIAAPVGITYGAMAGIDELRKLKGFEPIFLPFLSDVLLPNNEAAKIYAEQRKLTAYLTQNKLENQSYLQELNIVDTLYENKYLSKEEATQWRSDIFRNNSMLNQNSNEIKSKILSNLEKLNEIRNNRK